METQPQTKLHPHNRREHKHNPAHLNRVLWRTSIAVLITGTIMLTQFHMGHGAHAHTFAGIPRGIWIYAHRIAALCWTFALIHHLQIHGKIIRRILSPINRRPGQTFLLYLSAIAFLSGMIAWVVFPRGAGSTSASARHIFTDVHNFSCIFLTIGCITHITRRWKRMYPKQSHPASQEEAPTNQKTSAHKMTLSKTKMNYFPSS